jgi:hypothetical protein
LKTSYGNSLDGYSGAQVEPFDIKKPGITIAPLIEKEL